MSSRTCTFVSHIGIKCPQKVYANSNYCYWHNPEIDKSHDPVKERLEKEAKHGNIDFEGYQLKGCKLNRVNLEGCILMRTDLQNSDLSKANLRNVKFWEANLKDADLWSAYLEDSELEYPITLDNIRLKDAVLLRTRLKRESIEGKIREEQENRFAEAKESFLTLKNNFHSIGRYDDESWAFLKEKEMARRELFATKGVGNKIRWIASGLINLLCGYGEKPVNVLFSSIAIVLIFAVFFHLFGMDASAQTASMPVDQNLYSQLALSEISFSIVLIESYIMT